MIQSADHFSNRQPPTTPRMNISDPEQPRRQRIFLYTTIFLVLLLGLLLWVLPPERTLGDVIKVIFLHGALVQVGLAVFAAAGILGILQLVRPRPALASWNLALLETAVIVWVAYAAASMVSTYLSWGVWIAWDEPRVRASVEVLFFSVACLAVVLWVGQHTFTAIASILLAGTVWFLVKGAAIFRHPLDPIGTSTSMAYPWFFAGMLLLVGLLAVQLARWLRTQQPAA